MFRGSPCLAEGAFAFGNSGVGVWAAGTAFGYSDKGEAERVALNNCRSKGAGCKVVSSFKNSCLAFAVSESDGAWGWATSSSKTRAKTLAFAHCHRRGYKCEIKTGRCDGIEGHEPLLICAVPILKEVVRLKTRIETEPDKASEIADTINFLNKSLCRETDERLTGFSAGDDILPGCQEYAGEFRGEKVFWVQCDE